MASVIWVWDTQKMSLEAVLEQTSAVRCFQWDPRRPRLALCTGNTRLYLWTPAGCVSVQVPAEGNRLLWDESPRQMSSSRHVARLSLPSGGFQVQALNWHCRGDALIVIGKEQLCLCYMDADQDH